MLGFFNKTRMILDSQGNPLWFLGVHFGGRGVRYRAAVFAVLFSVSISGPVGAASVGDQQQFTSMSLNELMDLEVFRSATLLPTKHVKAAGTVYSFSRDDLVRLGVRRLDDLLQFVPGIQLNQYRKRHRSIWTRGLIDRYNDKLVLLVDGIRKRHLYYGHFSLGESLPIERVEKVEVIQGPASSLYGANAFGGIISITTREFSDRPVLETTLGLADNHRGKVSFLYNTPNTQVFGSYLGQDAPFRRDRKSFIGGNVLQPLDEDYANVSLKASPLSGLTLMADYQESQTPFLFIPSSQDAFVEERFLTLAARYETGDVDNGKLEASLFYTHDEALEYEKEQVTQSLGYQETQNARLAGATLTGFKRLGADHMTALGFAWQYEKAEEMDYERNFYFATGFLSPPESGQLLSQPGIVNNDFAVFAQDVWDINPNINLTLGGRYDYFEQFGTHFNYRGALVYSPDDRQTWKLLYGTAIRTPSFREYLKVLEGTTFDPPTPEPEQITSLELGFNYQWENAGLGITIFDNEVDDYIHEVPTPDGADEYFTNSSSSWQMRGAEALLRYQPTDKLSLRLGIGYLDAKEQGTGELPYLASWNGSFNANYRLWGKHNVGLSLFYNDNRNDTNSFVTDQPENFILTNLYAFGDLDKEWSYQFGVDNLFDERVYDPAGDFGAQYNTERAEREVWLRVKWTPSL